MLAQLSRISKKERVVPTGFGAVSGVSGVSISKVKLRGDVELRLKKLAPAS